MPIGTPFPVDRPDDHPRSASAGTPAGPIRCRKGRYPRGRGLALGYWRGTSMTSAAHITIAGDGRPMVTMGAVDLSGTRTTMAQVVAEEFGLPLEDVHIHTGDSKSVGYSDGAAGSRVARTMTAALVEACADALGQLRKRAAEKLQCAAGGRSTTPPAASARATPAAPAITLAELMQATLTDGAVVGRGVSTKLPLGVEIGAHVCDVEVDTDTGLVTVLRYTAFQDVGLALNPTAVEGQIEGSVVQGLGWALMEGFDYGAGRPPAQRQPARLPHADRARRAADRVRDRRDAGAQRALRRARRRRGADRAARRRRRQRHRPRHRRAHGAHADDAGARAARAAGRQGALTGCGGRRMR